ncbi:MAG: DUF951 domain-containing protein [Oscillibacter sp.]
MDLRLNDIVEMKKPHPCGEKLWLVTRVGMDIKLKCTRCGREVMLPRAKAEKGIKKIVERRNPMNKKTRAVAILLVAVMILSLVASMVIPYL